MILMKIAFAKASSNSKESKRISNLSFLGGAEKFNSLNKSDIWVPELMVNNFV